MGSFTYCTCISENVQYFYTFLSYCILLLDKGSLLGVFLISLKLKCLVFIDQYNSSRNIPCPIPMIGCLTGQQECARDRLVQATVNTTRFNHDVGDQNSLPFTHAVNASDFRLLCLLFKQYLSAEQEQRENIPLGTLVLVTTVREGDFLHFEAFPLAFCSVYKTGN